MNKKYLTYAAFAYGAWSVGIFLYQRTQGLVFPGGQGIPGYLDPLGYFMGYPNAFTATIGPITEVPDDS